MKTISIQQPWATLICSGIKDVENRTWVPNYTGRVLIHASSKKVPKNFEQQIPIEWVSALLNARLLGNLPEYSDLPTSAIIGYVDIVGYSDSTDSLWDGGDDCVKWLLRDAHLFDKPTLDVKGKLNLFEYPLDETNLPEAHKQELKLPYIVGTDVVMPVSESEFERIQSGGNEFTIDLTNENVDIFCPNPDSFDMVPLKSIKFIHNDNSLSFN